MRRPAVLYFFLLLLLWGCDTPPPMQQVEPAPSKSQGATAQATTQGIFDHSLEPQLVELTTGALPIWRKFSEQKPALVLMSFGPFLKPIPVELKQRATELVLQGSREYFDRHGSFFRADPVILPNQALSAAVDADLFSKIYWVFPTKNSPEALSLDKFRTQMLEAKFLSKAEVDELTLKDATFSGRLRGMPFSASPHLNVASIQEPLVLHIDLSYFQGLYNNEIKTPLYDLIHKAARSLDQSGWEPLSTTLSYSTLEGDIALETRFVMSNLAEVLADPSLLAAEAMPPAWALRAQALYAADMFTESKKLELYRQAAKLAPADPTALYDLFQSYLQSKKIDKALVALDRAITLDPGYGAAYLAIANLALQDGNLAATQRFLEKAAALYPLNPFVNFGRSELLLQSGAKGDALTVIDQLLNLDWSPIYHPDMLQVLNEMKQAALATESNREVKDEK